jgi:hypothetical protein
MQVQSEVGNSGEPVFTSRQATMPSWARYQRTVGIGQVASAIGAERLIAVTNEISSSLANKF